MIFTKFCLLGAILAAIIASPESRALESKEHFHLIQRSYILGLLVVDLDSQRIRIEASDHRFQIVAQSPDWQLIAFVPRRGIVFHAKSGQTCNLMSMKLEPRAFSGKVQSQPCKVNDLQAICLTGAAAPRHTSEDIILVRSKMNNPRKELNYSATVLAEHLSPQPAKLIQDLFCLTHSPGFPLKFIVYHSDGIRDVYYDTVNAKKVAGPVKVEIPHGLKEVKSFSEILYSVDDVMLGN